MSDSWFQSKIAPANEPDEGCRPYEAEALQAYINQSLSANEAAHALTQPISATENPYDNLYHLWGLLQDALVELPETEVSRLIELLGTIQDLPSPDPSKDFSWHGLPSFGHMWSDTYKRDSWRRTLSTKDSAKRAEQRAKHVRVAHVEAQLVVADVGAIPLDWGYDCIADALERKDTVLDFEIPAAAEWIAVSGKQLYVGVVQGRESWALERKRDFGKEEKKMSKERWGFWKERLREVGEQDEGVRDMARSAGKEMEVLMAGSG